MANEVSIDIAVETKKARQSIDKLEKSFSGFANKATSETQKATGAFEVFKGTLGTASVVKGLGLAKDAAAGLFNVFIADGIKAAQVQEDSINQLNIALKASGQFTTQASKDFQEYASSLQQSSKFGDEAILTNAALIQSLGGLSQDGLKGATQAALDLSASLGISLTSAATLVGKAAAGEVGSFSRYGLAIKKGADNAETFANALDQINSKFGGAAAGQVDTFSGSSQQLSNTFGDLTETFGFFTTKNGLVVAAIKGLNKGIAELDKIIKNNEESIKEFINNGLLAAVNAIQPLGNAVVFINDVFVGLSATWDFIQIGLNELIGVFISGTQTILETAKATKEFLGLDTSGIDAAIKATNDLKEAQESATQDLSDSIDRRLEAQQKFKDSVNSVTKVVSDNIKNEIELEKNKTEVIVTESQKQVEARTGSGEKELTEKEQINAKLLELEEAKTAGVIDLKAKEQLALQELEAIESERKEEERVVKLELQTEQADERLVRLTELLGEEEAIQAKAEARRLDAEGKVAQAKKIRLDQDSKVKKAILEKNAKDEMGSIFKIKKFEEMTQKEKLSTVQSTLGTIASLQSSGNKELFALGKAAAISTATIDGILGVQKALASLPFPANVIAAGSVGVAAAVNVTKIASQSFADGGVVPGIPSNRDNTIANVASGEVILNRRQQAETLFNIANGGGSGSGGGGLNINIEAGVGGISTDQVDFLIDELNNATEFRNQELRSA